MRDGGFGKINLGFLLRDISVSLHIKLRGELGQQINPVAGRAYGRLVSVGSSCEMLQRSGKSSQCRYSDLQIAPSTLL